MKDDANASTVLELESDLIALDPETLKQTLLASLVPGRSVLLVAANVARVGTAALQLLLAFLREADQKGLEVDLRDSSRALRDAVVTAGLDRDAMFARALAPST